MIQSLKDVSAEAVKAYPITPRKNWVLDWPGQTVIAASTIYWTEEVTDAITNGTMKVIRLCMIIGVYPYMYMYSTCSFRYMYFGNDEFC